jgi:hypothetical protein
MCGVPAIANSSAITLTYSTVYSYADSNTASLAHTVSTTDINAHPTSILDTYTVSE